MTTSDYLPLDRIEIAELREKLTTVEIALGQALAREVELLDRSHQSECDSIATAEALLERCRAAEQKLDRVRKLRDKWRSYWPGAHAGLAEALGDES